MFYALLSRLTFDKNRALMVFVGVGTNRSGNVVCVVERRCGSKKGGVCRINISEGVCRFVEGE